MRAWAGLTDIVKRKKRLTREDVFIFFILLYVCFLPFAIKAVSLVIAVLLLITLYDFFTGRKKIHFSPLAGGFILLYVLYFAGLLYSGNREAAWFDMEVKLSFLLLPAIIMVEWESIRKHIRLILMAFVYGSLATMLISELSALYRFSQGGTNIVFYYERLSVFLHPSYLGMYINFSILVVFVFLQNNILKNRWLWASVILLSLVFLYFLSSRTNIIVGVILAVVMLFYDKVLVPQKWLKISLAVAFMALVFFTKNERFRQINAYSLNIDQINMKAISSTSARVLLWHSSLDVIKKNFWTGVGIGDSKDELSKQNIRNGYEKLGTISMNAHNQYLEVFLKLGFTGFLVLMYLMLAPVYRALRTRDLLLLGFSLIVVINFLTESMLNREAGVLFVLFFYVLLVLANQENGFPYFREAQQKNTIETD